MSVTEQASTVVIVSGDHSPCCAPTADRGARGDGDASADGRVGGGGSGDAAAVRPGGVPVDASTSRAMLDLLAVPGGVFSMGTDDPRGYSADGEGPVHEVELGPFLLARYAVTNDQFAAFVDATGYVTVAEQMGSSFVFGGLLPDDFPPTRGVVGAEWWREVLGASWRCPQGAHSSVEGRGDHPVVHVSWLDAMAFCAWTGTRLPTEAEWERAARGVREGQHFPWGDDLEPGGEHRMNVFQGVFPGGDSGADGWVGTCPVGSYPPNDHGLHEMTGNVWEWCADWFHPGWYARSPRVAPTGPATGDAKVMRGGSYLCHESYCWRYRVDARSANTPESSTGNLGFRVAADV